MIPDVVAVEIVGGYRIRVTFDDGASGVVDLEPRMKGPVFQELLADRKLFEAIRVDPDLGTIAWPNDADWDPETLYALATTGVAPAD
jgi:hypothetical protein